MTTWLALFVVACSGSDTHVGCSPTPSCSLHDARIEPAPKPDAGPPACDPGQQRCRAAKIAAGGAHSCAIAQAGELYCWGSDAEGQLGTLGSDEDAGSDKPVLSRITAVATGGSHSCALDKQGTTLCWGRDAEGQVDGVARSRPVRSPTPVPIAQATGIAAGAAHSCAVVAAAAVCWGSARYGQVGRAVMDGALGPGRVPGTDGAVQVAAGARHSCALLGSGRVLCWGELIDPDSGEPRAGADAVEVPGVRGATAITAGAGHSCALLEGGHVVCWGRNDSGQLGDGTTHASATPVAVKGLEQALDVAAGGTELAGDPVGHSCAVDKDFLVECWGRNAEGQLGIGRAPDSLKPVVVLPPVDDTETPYLDGVSVLSAGGLHTCAVDSNGRALCWGDDSAGQLGGSARTATGFGRATRVAQFTRFR